ncbi:MAG TPA: AMP-binding protein [Streptosporangiaceae bacterium]|jgi:long-chain acyl-CoA synthetase
MAAINELTFGDILGEHRRSRPRETAVVDGGLRLTYAELDARVNRLANALAAAGTGRGDRVLWLGRTSFRVLEALLACGRLGAICCPANWRSSADELAFVLDDLAPSVVLFEDGEVVAAAREKAAGTARWVAAGPEYEAFAGAAPATEPDADVAASDPLLAQYTAAFSGRPRAALLSHAALVAHDMALAYVRRPPPGFTFLNSGPLFHVGTMMFCLLTFHLGGTNVFLPEFDPARVCALVEAERCTHAFLFGPMIDRLVEANRTAGHDLTSLRFCAHSPEWDAMITVDDSPWCASAFGGYGQTEVGGMLTYAGLAMGAAGAAGRPSPLVAVRIVDPYGAEVPDGEVGEIVARGAPVMSGYLNRPELTAAKRSGGWHHTGDLGRREPDGTLTFVGPRLRMIKSGAENIYPAEVERALKGLPGVADAAVIGVPDPEWGQAVRAIVVPEPGVRLVGGTLIALTRASVASYKKPRDIVFAEAIPKKGFAPDYDALDAAYGGGGYPVL